MKKLSICILAFFMVGICGLAHAYPRWDGHRIVNGDQTVTGNITMSSTKWIGLGAAKGRLVVTDTTVDDLNFLGCVVTIGDGTPGTATGAEDLYVESDFEVDGTANFDNNVVITLGSANKVLIDGSFSTTGTTESLDINSNFDTATATADVIGVTITATRASADTGGTWGLHNYVTTGNMANGEESYNYRTGGTCAASVTATSYYSGFYAASPTDGQANCISTAFKAVSGWDYALLVYDTVCLGNSSDGANLELHDASTITVYEDGDNYSASLQCKDGAAAWLFNDDVEIGASGAEENLTIYGTLTGTEFAKANQHLEIGTYLASLTAPKAIVGLTGTMADTATETGYEDGAGLTWTYAGTTTADKIFKGQTYVIDCDGTDDNITTPDTADLSFDDSGANPMSICAWVQIVASTGTQTIISKWDITTSSEAREWQLGINSTEKLFFQIYDESADGYEQITSDAALTTDTWYFVVVTYDSTGGNSALDGANAVMYVNGVAVAETVTDDGGGAYTAMENLGALVRIGASEGTAGVAVNPWIGDIGRVFVTGEELAAATVWKMYEQTRGFYNE